MFWKALIFRSLFFILMALAIYRLSMIVFLLSATPRHKRKQLNLLPYTVELIFYIFGIYSAYVSGFMHLAD